MKHELFELWAEYEGSRKVWKIQLEKGILTFFKKRNAVMFQEITNKEINRK